VAARSFRKAILHQEVDALGRELALGNLEQAEYDVPALDRVGLLDQIEEAAWNWTGIFSAIAARSRVLETRLDCEGSRVAGSTPASLASLSRTAAP